MQMRRANNLYFSKTTSVAMSFEHFQVLIHAGA
jgi:hypothetical protein